MRRPLAVIVASAVLLAGSSGCYSKATAYDAKFTLGYATGVQFENFVKPIAPGAKLDVVVFANGSAKKLAVSSAKSSAPSVLAVASTSNERIVLRGVSPGVAELEVTAADAEGKTLVDKMFFHVARPAKHALEHVCTEGTEAAYVRGDDVDILHNLSTSDDRAVIGYDYAPVKVEPAGALELVAQPQAAAFYRYRAPSARGQIALRSTVDDKSLTARVVERGDLKDAFLHSSDRMVEGATEYVVAEVTIPGVALCSQRALTKAKSLTPEICRVSASLDDDPGEDSNREQLATVRALKFGVCKYQVILPELAGGKGIVLEGDVKVGRLQFPSDKRAADAPPRPRIFGYERDAWVRAGWWLLASRVTALAFVMGWLRGRSTASSSKSSA